MAVGWPTANGWANGGAVYGCRVRLNGVASIPATSGYVGITKYNDIYSGGITALELGADFIGAFAAGDAAEFTGEPIATAYINVELTAWQMNWH